VDALRQGGLGQAAESEFWRATAKRGILYFNPPDVPIRVWAVSIQPTGVIWAEAEVRSISERNVMISYAGETARLDREKLWKAWALWRGIMFASSRSGQAAQRFDEIWQDRYGRASGGVPPVMQMALAEAMALLGVPADFTREDVLAAFRREAKKAHPDAGCTGEMFRRLVEARDRLLASLGTSAPAAKAPQYAPKGARVIYRRVRVGGAARIGSTRGLA
jgi:anti-sigma-K factor RskA